jgi:hypothetical protein
MFDFVKPLYGAVASNLDLRCYRAKDRARRLCRAWGYITGRLSANDAQWIMFECERPAGCHPLLTLTVEDTLEQARETLADHPELPRLIADGCERVGHKWESYNDDLYHARQWAIDLAQDYAANEGITLVRLDEDDALPDVKHAGGIAEGGEP